MTYHTIVLYQVTLPVSVELRTTRENSLILAEHLDTQYELTEPALAQVVRFAHADKRPYEAVLLDHVQRVLTTHILKNGKGRRFQDYVQTTHDDHVWVRVRVDGEITYTRPAA